MYLIKGATSGLVMVRFIERDQAIYWLECNNFDERGVCLNLYTMEKVK
jgi:hypothetical protein